DPPPVLSTFGFLASLSSPSSSSSFFDDLALADLFLPGFSSSSSTSISISSSSSISTFGRFPAGALVVTAAPFLPADLVSFVAGTSSSNSSSISSSSGFFAMNLSLHLVHSTFLPTMFSLIVIIASQLGHCCLNVLTAISETPSYDMNEAANYNIHLNRTA